MQRSHPVIMVRKYEEETARDLLKGCHDKARDLPFATDGNEPEHKGPVSPDERRGFVFFGGFVP